MARISFIPGNTEATLISKLELAPDDVERINAQNATRRARSRPSPLNERLTAEEREAHARFIAGELQGDVIWRVGR